MSHKEVKEKSASAPILNKGVVDTSNQVTKPSALINEEITGHLLTNLNRIYESLKFVDQKAGLLIAANFAILALTDKLLDGDAWTLLRVLSFLGAAILVVGSAFAFMVIIPRGEKRCSLRGPGFVDPIRINAYPNADTFSEAISRCSLDDLIKELYLMHYDYSNINCVKYKWLRRSIGVSVVAWIITLSCVVTSKL